MEALSRGYDTVVNEWTVWGSVCLQCSLPIQPVARTMPFATSSDSYSRSNPRSIWTLYHLRQPSTSKLGPTKTVLALVQRCMLHGWPSQEPNYRRSAAELEEARVECAGWLCTLGCKSGCSTTRKRASNPRTMRDTCTPRHWKDEEAGKKPCVVDEPQWRSGSRPQN